MPAAPAIPWIKTYSVLLERKKPWYNFDRTPQNDLKINSSQTTLSCQEWLLYFNSLLSSTFYNEIGLDDGTDPIGGNN